MNIATLLRRAATDHAEQAALRLDDTEIRYLMSIPARAEEAVP